MWLANAAFTEAHAEYGIDSDTVNVINQNTAPSGWNTIGSHFITGRTALVQLGTFITSSAHMGADIIQLTTFNAKVAAVAPAVEAMARLGACGESTDDPEVVEIQGRMLDAVDNYDNLKGSFHVMFSNSGQDETVDFELSEAKPGSFTKVTDAQGGVREHRFDGDVLVGVDPTRRTFAAKAVAVAELPTGPRHFRDATCAPVFVHRQDRAAAHAAADVAHPQNYAFWLTGTDSHVTSYTTWKGRPATVIEGRHDKYLADKLGATGFKMTVDDATGVLLALVGNDDLGNEAYRVDVIDLTFDGKIDRAHFAVAAPDDFTDISLDR